MKKFIIGLFAVGLVAASANAASISLLVLSSGVSNMLSGPVKVKQIAVAATAASGTVSLIDAPTAVMTYTNTAYTNTLSWATNWNYIYTNYFGKIETNSYTNVLFDATNTLVAGSTNLYPARATIAVATNTTTTLEGVNYFFNNGVTITNRGNGSINVTLVYEQ